MISLLTQETHHVIMPLVEELEYIKRLKDNLIFRRGFTLNGQPIPSAGSTEEKLAIIKVFEWKIL